MKARTELCCDKCDGLAFTGAREVEGETLKDLNDAGRLLFVTDQLNLGGLTYRCVACGSTDLHLRSGIVKEEINPPQP